MEHDIYLLLVENLNLNKQNNEMLTLLLNKLAEAEEAAKKEVKGATK